MAMADAPNSASMRALSVVASIQSLRLGADGHRQQAVARAYVRVCGTRGTG
jgi:hypothetical protein